MLIPTFNRFPIKANTSFDGRQHGIINSTLKRYKTLAEEELATINHVTKDIHQQVSSLAVYF